MRGYDAWKTTEPDAEPPVKCGGCSQPATRRCAFDVADVCDYCGEQSDADKLRMEIRDRRDAIDEARGDYMRDERR